MAFELAAWCHFEFSDESLKLARRFAMTSRLLGARMMSTR